MQAPNSFKMGPDNEGQFGIFGGRFVAETLMPNILELDEAYKAAKKDPEFLSELAYLNKHYTGRPSPLYFAERLTAHLGGAKVYFKNGGWVIARFSGTEPLLRIFAEMEDKDTAERVLQNMKAFLSL